MNPMIIPSAVGAVGSLIGGIFSNKASSNSAQRQMDFQREMSNTAYQRAVQDMRAAGINPLLAAMRGGASSPSGASYQAVNPAGNLAGFAQAYSAGLLTEEQGELMDAQAYSQRMQGFSASEMAKTQATVRELNASQYALNVAQRAYQEALTRGVTADNASKEAIAKVIRSNPDFWGKMNVSLDLFLKMLRFVPGSGFVWRP